MDYHENIKIQQKCNSLHNITIDEIYEVILSSDDPYEMQEYLYPENFKQCVLLKKGLFEE